MSSSDDDSDAKTRSGHRPSVAPCDGLYGDELTAGARIRDYVVESIRGRGGFATVYRVRHKTLGRIAALKLLRRELTRSDAALRRFVQEAQAVNRIRHPNIVDIYEFGDLPDGRPYFVMEWLDGEDLEQHLRAHGRLAPAEVMAVLDQLVAALGAAHAHGFVHRDIKASNVILHRRDGQLTAKLLDFGIAKMIAGDQELSEKLSSTGVRVGTPWNMAPEQIRCQAVDARTDVYALGVLLYHLLTGRLPFIAPTLAEVEEMHLLAAVPPASACAPVSTMVNAVITQCMAKEPARRFATVDEVAMAMRHALGGERQTPTRQAQRAGVALYVEAELIGAEPYAEEAAIDAVDAARLSAQETIERLGMTTALQTANAALGVALLPADEEGSAQLRARVVAAARSLHERLHERRSDHAGVRISVVVDRGDVVVRDRGDSVELVAGELLDLDRFTRLRDAGELAISPAARVGLVY